jgi:hypothetical protein
VSITKGFHLGATSMAIMATVSGLDGGCGYKEQAENYGGS